MTSDIKNEKVSFGRVIHDNQSDIKSLQDQLNASQSTCNDLRLSLSKLETENAHLIQTNEDILTKGKSAEYFNDKLDLLYKCIVQLNQEKQDLSSQLRDLSDSHLTKQDAFSTILTEHESFLHDIQRSLSVT